MQTKKAIIIGNLKENPATLKEAVNLTKGYIKLKKMNKWINLSVSIPYPFLYPIQKELGKSIDIYSQSISSELSGAHMGEVSANQLISIGIKNTIIGHSERRAKNETNTVVAKQVENALSKNMKIILCVGELTRNNDMTYVKFVEDQIETALFNVKKTDTKNITIAYEPVWAIGANALHSATQNEIYEMTIIIRKKLVDFFGKSAGGDIPIIYGGSANSDNADEIMSVHHIDGLLLGRASLDLKELKRVIDVIRK